MRQLGRFAMRLLLLVLVPVLLFVRVIRFCTLIAHVLLITGVLLLPVLLLAVLHVRNVSTGTGTRSALRSALSGELGRARILARCTVLLARLLSVRFRAIALCLASSLLF